MLKQFSPVKILSLSLVLIISLILKPEIVNLISPSAAQAQAVTPIPKPDPTKLCEFSNNPYRPNSGCEQEVPFIHSDIGAYSLTKTYKPEVIPTGQTCDRIPSGLQEIPGKPGKFFVEIDIYASASGIQLGGLGPDGGADADTMARHYIFNALADKPLFVNSPREAFRTFWRLLGSNTIFNAKAKFLERFRKQDPPIFNSEFPYSDLACQGGSPTAREQAYQGIATPDEVKQHLFEPSCNGEACYSYINAQAQSTTCGGGVLNPDLAIAVALNEDGGLVSNNEEGLNVFHFGCDMYCRLNLPGDVPTKTKCMLNTFASRCSSTDAQSLMSYGYDSGGKGVLNVQNLNAIMAALGTCPASAEKQTSPCFSIWVDPATAKRKADYLNRVLPTQTSLWARYYSGFIDSVKSGDIKIVPDCDPAYSVTAQLAGTSPLLAGTGGKAGVCSLPAGSSTTATIPRHADKNPPGYIRTSKPSSPCGGAIDTLDFIFPKDSHTIAHMTDGQNFQHYTSEIEGKPAVIWNAQTEAEPDKYFEEYTYDDKYIYFLRDNLWDQKCTDTGDEAYYALFDPATGKEGGPYIDRCVTPGKTYHVSVILKTYSKKTCQACPNNLSGTAETPAGTDYKVEVKQGRLGRELWIANIAGSGAGETKIFTEGLGLTGYQNDTNFAGASTDAVGSLEEADIEEIENTCKPGSDYSSLPTFTLAELAATLPSCLTKFPVCDDYLNVYWKMSAEMRSKYDAFAPFDFDSTRGYLASGYIPYQSTGTSYEFQAVKENLPFVLATNDVLNDGYSGIANALSPQLVNEERLDNFVSSSVSTPAYPSPGAVNKFFVEEQQTPAEYNAIYSALRKIFPSVWDSSSLPFWDKVPKITLKDKTGKSKEYEPHVNLPAPQTYPKEFKPPTSSASYKSGGFLTQKLRIPVKLKITDDSDSCDGGTLYSVEVDGESKVRNPALPLYDTQGHEITVFNDPLITNIDCATSDCEQSLFKQFLPEFARDFIFEPDYPIEGSTQMKVQTSAPSADIQTSVKITTDPGTSYINIPRTDKAAHMELCTLRNLWFIPLNSQSMQPQECYLPKLN